MGRDYRSKSFSDNMVRIEKYYGHPPPPTTTTRPNDFRSYNASYAAAPRQIKDWKIKNGSGKSWSFNDPEFQRKKRLASYRVYSVEGKVKGSVKKSFRWLKNKYGQVVYGSR